jgi:rhodanese-related sulfurtransferase
MIIVMLLALLLSGCGAKGSTETSTTTLGAEVDVQGGSYRDVSVSELQAMLEDKDFVFVNVHIPFEGDIPNTDLSIPYNEIEAHLDELPAEKNAKIVLYCRSDRMSNIAAEKLVSLGYTNIWNLEGGFNAWENEGLPIEGR